MIQAYLENIRCHEETDEVGADEPYVLVTAVDLASTVNVAGFPVPLPAFDVTLYGPFGDVDGAETHHTAGPGQSFWGLGGGRRQLDDPENAIFVVSMMENDDGDAGALRGVVKGVVGSSVLGSINASRGEKVAALLRDVDSASGTPTGAPSFDEKVGGPQELRFTADELARAANGELVRRAIVTRGDGGHYTMTFAAVNDFGVFGAIGEKWTALNRFAGPLGAPTSDETPTFDGTGRTRSFAHGFIAWHPAIGANGVWGAIGERWAQIGREQFGYPITDELAAATQNGRFNHFRALQLEGHPEASIFWSPATGAHEMFGAIRQRWLEMGGDRSHLGFPTGHEHDHAGGRLQRFQGGALFWTAAGGVVPA